MKKTGPARLTLPDEHPAPRAATASLRTDHPRPLTCALNLAQLGSYRTSRGLPRRVGRPGDRLGCGGSAAAANAQAQVVAEVAEVAVRASACDPTRWCAASRSGSLRAVADGGNPGADTLPIWMTDLFEYGQRLAPDPAPRLRPPNAHPGHAEAAES